MKLLIERFNGETLTIDGVLEVAVMREPKDLLVEDEGTCTWANLQVFTDGELLLVSGAATDG